MRTTNADSFPDRPRLIVGIGASAGGLEAFKAFFSTAPADGGLAFVLLPQLLSDHQSLMVELQAGQTAMPVGEAQHGQRLEANRIYVLPPAGRLTIRDGKLQLSAAEEPCQAGTAFDLFLHSLAEDQRERAVGIILSGTGSHGSLGLKEIKLAGGFVIAQDPDTAGYDQMPNSAIATGLVDLVLAPAHMAAALQERKTAVNGGAPANGRTGEVQKRLQTILNSVADAIIIIDKEGLIQYANPATEQIFGYAAHEMTGRAVSFLMPSPNREEHGHHIARHLETGKRTALGTRRELTGRRKDGSTFPAELTVSQIGYLGLFAGVLRDLSEKRRLEREVADAITLEQERIGREIHDGIGQQLTGLNILAVSLKNELVTAGLKDTGKLDDMIRQLTSLIGDARRLSHGLAPVAVGSLGLVDALKRLTDLVNETMGVNCNFHYSPTTIVLQNEPAAMQIYRIAQEAVNNALKYANATRISVDLNIAEGVLALSVSDDGKGFDFHTTEHNDGFGLRILQYRAGILGGELVIDTAPGKGTLVRLQMPYQAVA
jgi:PAS domain S-box-containing protein